MEGRPTVLVVEDSEATREWLRVALERAGYEAALVANGEQALARLRGGPRPALVILDMLMPVLDGWHFLGRLRMAVPGDPPPVVVTTATHLSRDWATDHGCRGFLRKPFDEAALLAEVRRCAAPAERRSAPRLAAGPWALVVVLDSQGRVLGPGQVEDLSGGGVRLLVGASRRPGEALALDPGWGRSAGGPLRFTVARCGPAPDGRFRLAGPLASPLPRDRLRLLAGVEGDPGA